MSECDDGRGYWLDMVRKGMAGKVGRGVSGASVLMVLIKAPTSLRNCFWQALLSALLTN